MRPSLWTPVRHARNEGFTRRIVFKIDAASDLTGFHASRSTMRTLLPCRFRSASRVFAALLLMGLTASRTRAQDTPLRPSTSPAAGDVTRLETFVVGADPIYQSQSASIELQREAPNFVSVIAADSVGRFPDQNAAAALGRLPAIAIQRDQGQERFIQVRGAPARWTTVAFDGINVIGAQERIFRFDSVPANLLQSLEINKTLTPAMSAESIAGLVNLVSYSPFLFRGLSTQLDAGYGYMELGGGEQRQFAGRVGYSEGKWGVFASASHYLREQVTDNREFVYDASDLPTRLDLRNYKLERQNNAYTGGVEFRPSEGQSLFFKSIYSEFIDDEERNQYVIRLDQAANLNTSGVRQRERGDLAGVGVTTSLQYGRYENSTWTNTLGGDHALGEWSASWRVNYTEADSSTFLPILQSSIPSAARPSLTYDLSDRRFPVISLFATSEGARGAPVASLDLARFATPVLVLVPTLTETDAYTGKLDLKRLFQTPARPWTLSFGAQWDDREATGYTFTTLASASPVSGLSITPFITNEAWETDFPRGFGVNYIDNQGLRRELERLVPLRPAPSPSDSFDITEEIRAAYLQVATTFGDHEILAGARVEQVDLTSAGAFVSGGTAQPLRVTQDYADVFPSVNVKFKLRDDLLLRLGGTSGIGRPDFSQIRVGATANDIGRTVSGGNPTVDPEFAYGGDVALEWYLAEGSLVSVGYFHRRVDDVLFDATAVVQDDRFDSPGLDRTGYSYVTTLNGSDGQLSGWEFSYSQQWKFLPAPFDGFGVQGNLAVLDGEFKAFGRELQFPGTSDQIVNASLFYEKYGWSVRVSYQWRDDWIDDVDVFGEDDVFWHATEQVDVSVRYRVSANITIFADLNNLTDELGIRYQGTPSQPIEVEGFGRRYLAGIKLNF